MDIPLPVQYQVSNIKREPMRTNHKIKIPDYRYLIIPILLWALHPFLIVPIYTIYAMYTGDFQGNNPETAEQAALISLLLATPIVLFIGFLIAKTNEIIFDGTDIAYHKRLFFKSTKWQEPIEHYESVTKRRCYHLHMGLSTSTTSQSHRKPTPYFTVTLTHGTDSDKSVLLYRSRNEIRTRKKWEEIAKLFELYAVEKSQYEYNIREHGDLDTNILEKLHNGSLTVDQTKLEHTSKKVTSTDTGLELIIQRVPPRSEMFFTVLGLILTVISAVLFFSAFTPITSMTAIKLIGALICSMGSFIYIIEPLFTSSAGNETIAVSKEGISYYHHLFDSLKLGKVTYTFDEIEDFQLRRFKDSDYYPLFIDSDAKRSICFQYIPHEDQQFVLHSILNYINNLNISVMHQ